MIARLPGPASVSSSSVRATMRLLLPGALAATTLALSGCSTPRDPIIVGGGMIVLENQTDREWRNVVVTVNDHFRGGVARLSPGGRLDAPLRDFKTAFGQKFDRGRQSVYKIDVTATDSTGAPVTLTWNGKLGG